MIKVSIIIPAYNVEKYIERCVSSLLDQTLQDIEVIVIDDGSTDNTFNKCSGFNDSRLILIQQDNLGVSAARNRGIGIATGEYIGFVDGDDYVEPNMFELLYNIANKENADIVNSKWHIVPDDKPYINKESDFEGIKPQEYTDYTVYSDVEMHDSIQWANKSRILWFVWKGIYKRSMLKGAHILFLTSLDFAEDSPFVLECMLNSKTMVSVDRQLYYYVQRKGSLTKTKYRTGYFEKMNKLYMAKNDIYNRYSFKEYDKDLNSYTMIHTIPMILSNELVSGKGFNQQKQTFIEMRSSKMVSEAFRACSLSLINSKLRYLAGLLKYKQYALLALICTLRYNK